MRLLFQIAILAVTAAVTFPGSGTGGAKAQPVETPTDWVIRMPIKAEDHNGPLVYHVTFQDEAECLEFLGSDEFESDLDEVKWFEHIIHAGQVQFGVPKCELRGAGGDPA